MCTYSCYTQAGEWYHSRYSCVMFLYLQKMDGNIWSVMQKWPPCSKIRAVSFIWIPAPQATSEIWLSPVLRKLHSCYRWNAGGCKLACHRCVTTSGQKWSRNFTRWVTVFKEAWKILDLILHFPVFGVNTDSGRRSRKPQSVTMVVACPHVKGSREPSPGTPGITGQTSCSG